MAAQGRKNLAGVIRAVKDIFNSPHLGMWSVLAVAPVGVFGAFLLVQRVSSIDWPEELRGAQLNAIVNFTYIVLGAMLVAIILVGGLIKTLKIKAGGNELELEANGSHEDRDGTDGEPGEDGNP